MLSISPWWWDGWREHHATPVKLKLCLFMHFDVILYHYKLNYKCQYCAAFLHQPDKALHPELFCLYSAKRFTIQLFFSVSCDQQLGKFWSYNQWASFTNHVFIKCTNKRFWHSPICSSFLGFALILEQNLCTLKGICTRIWECTIALHKALWYLKLTLQRLTGNWHQLHFLEITPSNRNEVADDIYDDTPESAVSLVAAPMSVCTGLSRPVLCSLRYEIKRFFFTLSTVCSSSNTTFSEGEGYRFKKAILVKAIILKFKKVQLLFAVFPLKGVLWAVTLIKSSLVICHNTLILLSRTHMELGQWC